MLVGQRYDLVAAVGIDRAKDVKKQKSGSGSRRYLSTTGNIGIAIPSK